VLGGSGIDTVYVKSGTTVDASGLGGGSDLVYMTGNWADYTKSISGSTMVFTRTVGSDTERVTVAAGTGASNDKLVFADGAALSNNIKTAFAGNPSVALSSVSGYDAATTTPGTRVIEPTLAIKAGQDANINAAETGVDLEVSYAGLRAGDSIQLQVGGANAGGIYTVQSSDVTAGKASINLAKALLGADGAKSIGAVVSDANSNSGSAASPLSLQVDTVAPTATIATALFSADTGISASDFNTKTAAQTISGTLSANMVAGEIVQVSTDNGTTWSTAATTVGANTWSLAATLTASDTLKVRVIDAAGNSGAVFSQAYVLDTTAPVAPSAPDLLAASDSGSSSTDNLTNNATPSLTGTAEAGATVTVYDTDGTTVLGTGVATGGNYAITTSTLGSGAHTLTAKATDAAGNVSAASTGLSVTIDTTAPTATISTVTFSADTGSSASDFITKTAIQTLSGTTSIPLVAGEIVEVSTNNGTTWSTAFSSEGSDVWGLFGALAAGSNTLKVRVTDAAGNSGAVLSQAYVLDTVAPTATIATAVFSADTGTAGDFNTATAAQTISGTLSANMVAGEVVEVSTNNGTSWTTASTTVGANSWSLAGVTLTASNTLKVRVTDTAGNSGTVHSQAYVLDTTAPTATIATAAFSADTGTAGDFNTATAAQTISGTLSANMVAGEVVEVSTNNGTSWTAATTTVGANTWSLAATLSASDTLKVRVTDTAGNSGAVFSQAYVLDTVVPTAAIATAAFSADTGTAGDFNTATAAQTISGTLSANMVAGEVVEVSTNNGTSWTTATTTVGANSWSLAGVTLTASDTLQVRVTDTAGNSGAVFSQAYVLDTVAPVVTSTALNAAENGTAVASLTATDASAVNWSTTLGGADAALFSLTAGGVLTFNGAKNYEAPDDAGANRVYDLTVQATDAAGNSSSQAITVSLTDVNEAPTAANAIADQTFLVGGAVDSFTFAANAFADPDTGAPNNTLTYTATLVGGGALPAWLSFDAGTRTFSGNPPSNGATTVRVTATDGGTGNLSTFDDFVINAVTAPVIQSFSTATTVAKSGTALSFSVVLSETVAVTGNPTLTFSMNGQSVTGTYSAGSGTNTLTFTAIAPSGDGSAVSIAAAANSGGSIIGNVSGQPWSTTSVGQSISTLAIDNTAPALPAVNTVATDDIVNASEQTATVTGTAEAGASVALTVGTGNVRTVTADGSGNWSYTLVAADITAMGQGAETLSATATDTAGNVSAAGTRAITVDTTAATVASVALTGATGAQNNTLNAGDVVTATVTFNEAVTVTGTPQLALNIGGTTVQANYASGSGSTALTFSYTILTTQTDADGIAVALDSLALNSGTLKDAAGNNATLTHAAVTDNASFMVDAMAPAAPVINPVDTDDIINGIVQFMPETVVITGTNEAGATVALSLGGNTRAATVTGTTWSYTLTAADVTAMGEGPETLSATQTDPAGNISAAGMRNIMVDTVEPAAPVIDLVATDDTINVSEQTAIISGSNEAGAAVALSLGGTRARQR
jgi:hypothetical protein